MVGNAHPTDRFAWIEARSASKGGLPLTLACAAGSDPKFFIDLHSQIDSRIE
jgi:hypothetical protein